MTAVRLSVEDPITAVRLSVEDASVVEVQPITAVRLSVEDPITAVRLSVEDPITAVKLSVEDPVTAELKTSRDWLVVENGPTPDGKGDDADCCRTAVCVAPKRVDGAGGTNVEDTDVRSELSTKGRPSLVTVAELSGSLELTRRVDDDTSGGDGSVCAAAECVLAPFLKAEVE